MHFGVKIFYDKISSSKDDVSVLVFHILLCPKTVLN